MSSKIEFNPTQSCREGEGQLMKGEGIEGKKRKEKERGREDEKEGEDWLWSGERKGS